MSNITINQKPTSAFYAVVHRVDEARLEKFLTEHDPLRTA